MDFKQGGQAIQRIRKERGMTQEQLAEITNVASNSISRIERGLLICIYRRPRATCTEELSQAAGVESQL